jgi:hypothetical protein
MFIFTGTFSCVNHWYWIPFSQKKLWDYCFKRGLKRKFWFTYRIFAKICFRFSRKKITKSYENNESFCENFRLTREAKMARNIRIPRGKLKFRSWRNAVKQRIRVLFRIKWEKLCIRTNKAGSCFKTNETAVSPLLCTKIDVKM